jgi:hypothetical protein
MPTAPAANVVVTGNIVDRDGAAVAGAYVYFRLPSAPVFAPPESYARTDPAGAFKIEVPEGIYLVNVDPDYESGLPQVILPPFKVSRQQKYLRYQFTGTKITGTITGPGGVPLQGARVAIASSTIGYVAARTLSGHYSMVIPPGDYELYVYPAYYASGLPRLEVDATIAATDTVLDFALTGRQVDVTATLGGAEGLAGVNVYAESEAIGVQASAITGVDGTCLLYLPDGTYRYTAFPNTPAIVGPESGTWDITDDASLALAFPGTRWNITLRRSSDNGAVAFAQLGGSEHGSFRGVGGVTDALGRLLLIVRPDVGYDFQVLLNSSITPNFFSIPNVSSAGDSTFDLLVNAPVP